MKNSRSRHLMAKCKEAVAPLSKHPYLEAAKSRLSQRGFLHSQAAFYPAVVAFPRHLLILLTRIESHHDRLATLRNVVEEHGDFNPRAFHHETFAAMLAGNGIKVSKTPIPEVALFNASLAGICATFAPAQAAAVLAAIELGFSPISREFGKIMIQRQLIPTSRAGHYAVHAKLDVRHAAELLETAMSLSEEDALLIDGFAFGVLAFERLYDGMLAVAESTQA